MSKTTGNITKMLKLGIKKVKSHSETLKFKKKEFHASLKKKNVKCELKCECNADWNSHSHRCELPKILASHANSHSHSHRITSPGRTCDRRVLNQGLPLVMDSLSYRFPELPYEEKARQTSTATSALVH
jgi:hypothetical protein